MPGRRSGALSERSPLLAYRLCSSTSLEAEEAPPQPRKLSTFLGVVVPTLLSMFSVVLFLRLGFVVGQAGLYQSLLMFLVAYFIIGMTVLSVCAISTNGALDAGGAYYMISRALGPEFGGSIGIMFFFANICGSALYILGLVEAVVDDFGIPAEGTSGTATQVLPRSYWFDLLYGTVLLFLCLLVCLVGAGIYAKATFLIFLVVMVVLGTVCLSFFLVGVRVVWLPASFDGNHTEVLNASFTGFKLSTLLGNLHADYSVDYTTGRLMSFSTVFAVMFNGCTGIMAGSNMSGDLKRPSYSIPRGTIMAVIFTYVVYNLLAVLLSCTCDRLLLQRDYSFLKDINIWPPFVIIGVYFSTLSAAMSNLIGASRILYALAKDDLFGKVLGPAKQTSAGGNPWVAVIFSWILVQLVLFSGKLNTIAAVVTIFFLLVYATVDLACLALEWASAPNFRPTFKYFTWHTCVLGIAGCVVMVFLISPIYASASVAFMVVLLVALHYLSPSSSWGYISQALIFHQVRKYLLMLDSRKEHVKFWRPQVLLMVRNPRTSLQLIRFINDLKKSGLYVLGHVELADLGGMRPNTIALGFYDNTASQDNLSQSTAFSGEEAIWHDFPPAWSSRGPKQLSSWEYVAMICDAMKMLRNVLLARYFEELKLPQSFGWRAQPLIDVWPINLLRPDSARYVDTSSLFLLQMACVLAMTRTWHRARLRLFLCVESCTRPQGQEDKLRQLLKDLRIQAEIQIVLWDNVVALHWHSRQEDTADNALNFPSNITSVSDEYLTAVNQLILQQTSTPTVRFLYLPRPPADTNLYPRYLEQLEILTHGLGPTLLVHGVSAVTSTQL
ncbi:solute carrier family 12 member 9-like isoform X2 [Python bivittatus]|uniref:Solute carrier family 12 member 9 n=1 Tax=Python bivittatus TaxID=176946 RepID=A0A9F5MXT9_PYTBI|nr:solute carrier family 12 member 9-like isoform X2 [Python bivittatus]